MKTDKKPYADDEVVLALQATKGPDAYKLLGIKIDTNPFSKKTSGWVSLEELAKFNKPDNMLNVGRRVWVTHPGFPVPDKLEGNPNTDKQFFTPLNAEFTAKGYLDPKKDIPIKTLRSVLAASLKTHRKIGR